MTDVTRILSAIERGEAKATDELLPLVYEELRVLAAQKLSHEPPGQTLQATALVHEAYLRLIGKEAHDWQGQSHFFRAAAEAMRCIIIDNVRRKKSARHGGEHCRVNLDAAALSHIADCLPDDLIAMDEALARLSGEDETRAEVVKLRYFAGLSVQQTADILGISPTTVKRYWAYARAWLLREIEGGRS